ncbi:MAG TPA: cytochrome c biogenesis protein ResB [Egibacteraceae bacterium]
MTQRDLAEVPPQAGGPAQPPPRPGLRLPEIPGPLETAVWAWRRLRRMSTALVLLFALATASVVATFVPQEPTVPNTVAEWREGVAGPGPFWAEVFERLGFFDVFGSWWFAVITVLLFVSLTGCLLPRWLAFAKVVRRPPAAGRNLGRLSNHVVLRTTLAPDAALGVADGVLRRRRYRRRRLAAGTTASGSAQLAAERGHAREGGSLVFHTAFYLLLVGILVGHLFGFVGQVNLAEGSSFAETRIAYDAAEPGRWFGVDDHRGFVVRLDDFAVDYHEDFAPREYRSQVTISEGGREVRSAEIRVNEPLAHAGMKLYQMRFGMAPRVVVRAGDLVLFDEPVMLSDAGGGIWTGAAKVAVSDPDTQIALDLVFLPDAQLVDGRPVSVSPEPNNPRLIASLYVGELGLERPVPASQFNREGGPLGPPAILSTGESAEMADGNLTVEFAELRQWSGFQVTHAPGRGILLVAATLILVGLVPSLHSYRRRVWVEARHVDAGTEVVLAGVALQRKSAFAEEFSALTAQLREALPAADETIPRERNEG